MTSSKKGPKPTPKQPSNPDDWSDPKAHPQMSAGVPIAIMVLLLLGLIAYGLFTS